MILIRDNCKWQYFLWKSNLVRGGVRVGDHIGVETISVWSFQMRRIQLYERSGPPPAHRQQTDTRPDWN